MHLFLIANSFNAIGSLFLMSIYMHIYIYINIYCLLYIHTSRNFFLFVVRLVLKIARLLARLVATCPVSSFVICEIHLPQRHLVLLQYQGGCTTVTLPSSSKSVTRLMSETITHKKLCPFAVAIAPLRFDALFIPARRQRVWHLNCTCYQMNAVNAVHYLLYCR